MQDDTGKVEKVVRDNLQRFYTNQYRIETSNVDASIVFAQSEYQVDAKGNRTHVVNELAKVSMATGTMKLLVDSMTEMLKQHEEKMAQNEQLEG